MTQFERLCENVDPKAKLPRGFGLWSQKMQLGWLRQHQVKPKAANGKKSQ